MDNAKTIPSYSQDHRLLKCGENNGAAKTNHTPVFQRHTRGGIEEEGVRRLSVNLNPLTTKSPFIFIGVSIFAYVIF
jgi:hypothetical protein